MPIFQKGSKSILFMHVPKAGGSYVEQLFVRNGFSMSFFDNGKDVNPLRVCSPQHYHTKIIQEILRLDKFDYIFMVTRHPVLRFLSEFKMRNNKRERPLEINEWLHKVYKAYAGNKFIYDNHFRPQKDFYIEGIDFYKQDDGFDDFFTRKLERKIGVDFEVKK